MSDEFPQPLFILCPGRSFSSVVCAVIGQHPQAFGVPELNLFVAKTVRDLLDFGTPVIGVPGLLTGIRRTLSELLHGEQTDETVAQADLWLADRQHWTGAQMFREICRLASPRLVVEKSPTNTRSVALTKIAEEFPEARYLHLSRHPRATCRSRHESFNTHRRKRNADDDHELYWLERHARILEFQATLRPDQYILLQGEWFLEDPDTVLRQICEWLEISSEDAAIEAMKHPENSPFSRYGPGSARAGNNMGFLGSPKLRIGKPKEERLDGALEWAGSEKVRFGEDTVMLAQMLGYR